MTPAPGPSPVGAVWVADSTPLIMLAKAGHLTLLTEFAADVLVPQTVADEVLAGDAADPARLALEGGWGRRVPVPPMTPALAAIRLDPGEKAALAVALATPGAWVLMDDRKGRTAAQRLGVPVIGTVGVALRAKAEGRIPSARAVVQAIRAAGFYADDAALARALAGVGETWP